VGVHDGERADGEAIAGCEGDAGVEANALPVDDYWEIGESLVRPGIWDHEGGMAEDGVRTEGSLAGELRRFEPVARFEPASILGYEADDGTRRVEELGGKTGDAVKTRLWRGIQNAAAVESR
jgi:hypothetical protein